MKILLSADFEGNFTRLFQVAETVDLCICCGDVFNYHQYPKQDDFEFPLPFFSIKGNKETWGKEKLHYKLERIHNFFWLNEHLDRLKELTGLLFFGIDYLHEPASIPKDLDVLVSHEPAFGLADQCSDPFHTKMVPHCGNKKVRKLVDQFQPAILVAGHVHHFQKEQTEKTLALTLPAALSDPITMITENGVIFS
ncbi:MAG: metallophosphoesterase family protein [Candidatus Heimdallarchaeota archaeon]|nr:MAG: metallophosphoesterase family protein [Candidatus Heimdallarchaeota archaeon]